MKNLYPLLFSCLLISSAIQAQVIENPGFEEWETIANGNPEPVNWSSIQSGEPAGLAAFSPQVLFQESDNPHSGDYCIRLQNVFVALANITANGLLTNGRVHADFNPELGDVHTESDDEQFFTLCDSRPDSIVGYYRYAPQGDDITTVQALLHTGTTGKLPDDTQTGWVGLALFESPNSNVDEWTRFSAPFQYFSEEVPDYILFNLSAGNGTNATAESQAWYDDLELVYNTVGLNEKEAEELLNVYFADNHVMIDTRQFSQGDQFSIEIFNVTGQLVLEDKISSGELKKFSLATRGVYICTLRSDSGITLTNKVVVQ